MVGGATVISVGEKDRYVTPAMCRTGDRVIITKGPAIEAVGILVTMFPELISNQFGEAFSQKAQGIFYKMSVVDDALTAVGVGVREDGVTAMHDATECGIWGALYELCQASGLGITVDADRIVVEECVPEICRYFAIDPYSSISEGTLVIACREHRAADIVAALSRRGIRSSVAAELTEARQGMTVLAGGVRRELVHPRVDPFWKAFYTALEKKDVLTGGAGLREGD